MMVYFEKQNGCNFACGWSNLQLAAGSRHAGEAVRENFPILDPTTSPASTLHMYVYAGFVTAL
jgi:hypothetical protein